MAVNIICTFFSGHISKKSFKILIPCYAILFFTFMILSAIVFPGGYNPLLETISSLGNPSENPFPGWLFFCLAFWSLSILFIPFYLWIYRRMKKIHWIAADLALLASMISSLGMILLGFFPEGYNTQNMHNLSAALSFGGFIFSSVFSWIPMINDSRRNEEEKRNFSPIIVALMVIILSIAVSGVVAVELCVTLDSTLWPVPWYAMYPFWEWNLLYAIAIHEALLAITTPESIRT